ncbi:MAG: DUF4440 domain-containing protein [Rudaea sp.]|nr:DUF4440 domain-containing protein [Rudaea sp.]
MTPVRSRHLCPAAILVLASTSASADEAPAPVKKEIVALTQQLMDAIGDGKPEVWQRALTEDALITDEFGRRQDKTEAVKSIRPLPAGFSGSIEVRDPHVRAHGDTVVIDFEGYEQETVFGQKLVVRYLFTATYVRRDGTWKLAGMLDVTLPTQPPMLKVRDMPLADYPGTYRYGPDRAFLIERNGDKLVFRTKAGGPAIALDPIARDVFMGGDDERNLLVFRRDESGHVTELIERRKFNDLHLKPDIGK